MKSGFAHWHPSLFFVYFFLQPLFPTKDKSCDKRKLNHDGCVYPKGVGIVHKWNSNAHGHDGGIGTNRKSDD